MHFTQQIHYNNLQNTYHQIITIFLPQNMIPVDKLFGHKVQEELIMILVMVLVLILTETVIFQEGFSKMLLLDR